MKKNQEDVGYTILRFHALSFLKDRLKLMHLKVANNDPEMLVAIQEIDYLDVLIENLEREKIEGTGMHSLRYPF